MLSCKPDTMQGRLTQYPWHAFKANYVNKMLFLHEVGLWLELLFTVTNTLVCSDCSRSEPFREAPMLLLLFNIAFNVVILNLIDFCVCWGVFSYPSVIDFLLGKHLCCCCAV